MAGRIVEALLHRDPRSDEILRQREEMPFYREQARLVLRNCGVISAHIDDYLKYRGYAALALALAEMNPEQVIEEVKNRACGAAVEAVSYRSQWGLIERRTVTKSSSSATPTRAIRVPSWIAIFWKEIRTALLKG